MTDRQRRSLPHNDGGSTGDTVDSHDRSGGNVRFAFYGRVSTEDNQDPEASRAWQLSRARALVEPRGGRIVMEFFDVDKSRSIPWSRRPYAAG